MIEVAAVAGSSLWRVITAQTRTSRGLEPVQTWRSFKWYAFTLNHSYCEWKCERPHCALSFMLNSLFPRNTWTANLSKVCFAEWKHPFPRWPNMSVSPLVMNIPWLHDRSLASSAGDMWRLKPAATFAVRLRFPQLATIAVPRRDKPLYRHSWSAARLAWKQRAHRRRAWECSRSASRTRQIMNVIRVKINYYWPILYQCALVYLCYLSP